MGFQVHNSWTFIAGTLLPSSMETFFNICTGGLFAGVLLNNLVGWNAGNFFGLRTSIPAEIALRFWSNFYCGCLILSVPALTCLLACNMLSGQWIGSLSSISFTAFTKCALVVLRLSYVFFTWLIALETFYLLLERDREESLSCSRTPSLKANLFLSTCNSEAAGEVPTLGDTSLMTLMAHCSFSDAF